MSAGLPLTLGTAGHVDHGKTALVAALTGVDTDRLPQERDRGISIELGYARLELPSGRSLSLVDVPGHERFVATMVAGATGVDLYLMAIAADDGVMPQTREHAAVLAALGVQTGVVAITKSDLADPAPALARAAELLPGATAVAVSARTGAGLDELRAALDDAATGVPGRSRLAAEPARLHIDRVFTVTGAGTVVTGTLWSGTLRRGEPVTLLPGGRCARIRGLQIHDRPTAEAPAGQRVAVNLTGVRRDEVDRGDLLTGAAGALMPTYRVDAAVTLAAGAREPEPGARVQVHHGTRDAPARLTWLGGRFWQLRLERPLLAAAGDRFVIRRISPPGTIGGGLILDGSPSRHGPSRALTARLTHLLDHRTEPQAPVAATGARGSRGVPHAGARSGPQARVPDNTRELLIELARRHDGSLTLAQARDALGGSREQARAILQQLAGERVFVRRGEVHVLRRSRSGS